jgi:putative acetyltransferase
MRIERDDPFRDDVLALLDEHLTDMRATSPPESVHALDPAALTASSITFWTLREDGVLLGCGALKDLGAEGGEIKSMRTTPSARGRGVATLMLLHVLGEAGRRGYRRLSLETGSQEFFAPARRLYLRHGFVVCGPFGDYTLDPNSVYLTLELEPSGPPSTAPDQAVTSARTDG